MQNLTPEGLRMVAGAAERHGVSLDAAVALLGALAEGNGRQAQFNHPDLGGMGQWSEGGMIMVGDMFNHDLKARVDALGNDLPAFCTANRRSPPQADSPRRKARAAAGSVYSLLDPVPPANGGQRNSAVLPPPAPRMICDTLFSQARVVSRSSRTGGSACTTPASIGSQASLNSRAAIGR